MSVRGWVFDIQRFCLHDGPGIRTTVFLKGCPLRCPWCHNPEGLERDPQIRLSLNSCVRCGRCALTCPHGCHEIKSDGQHLLHLGNCVRCGACVEACPAAALALVGKRMSVKEVLSVVLRDLPFYKQSGGGMTLSGGEPMAQFAFTRALLETAREAGIATAIETAALAPWSSFEKIKAATDLFFVDLKHTDDRRHRELTGVSNKRILANIRKMAEAGWPLIIRIPWVPTYNVEESFLSGLESFLTSLPESPPVEFMLYHRLGIGKWTALGGKSEVSSDLSAASNTDAAPWIERLKAVGINAKIS